MSHIVINNRHIGPGYPTYIVAEMSANHNHDFDRAVMIMESAGEAGADAIKIQTYTPDTLTINCDKEYFRIGKETTWAGKTLYELYKEAYTPWDWQPKLKSIAEHMKLDFFSTPFDSSAVEFLQGMDVPAYKVASFENVDLPLLRTIAATGKPIIMSTGMATLAEIYEAVQTVREAGGDQLALLKCTSAYPAPAEEMNLRTIPHMAETFGVPVGLSDHTTGSAVAVAAVVLGACIVEKHLTLSRKDLCPDSAFSMEPGEFKSMVEAIRLAEKAVGKVQYATTYKEKASRVFRRSLFACQNIKAGDRFTLENVRSIRPGCGLHTRYLVDILNRRATKDIERGTPLTWDSLMGD
jgi:pseudaminic acid synthase